MISQLVLAFRILGNHFREPRRPYKLTFAVTGRCNARCRTCGIWRHQGGEELTVREIGLFFARNPYFSWLDLTGGEFFLRPDAGEIVSLALTHSRHCHHLHIPTNGVDVALTLAGVHDTLACRPHLFTLTLSLDGPPPLHDRLRGVPGNWDSIMTLYQSLKGLTNRRFRIFFGFTLSAWNVGHMQQTVAAVQQRFPQVGWHDFHLNLHHTSTHYYRLPENENTFPENTGPWLEEVEHFRQHVVQRRLDPLAMVENQYLGRVGQFLRTGASPLPCQALGATLFLAADGTLFPCTIWNQPLGNIRDHDYHLVPPSWKGVRQTILQGGCPGCWTPCEAYPAILARALYLKYGSHNSCNLEPIACKK